MAITTPRWPVGLRNNKVVLSFSGGQDSTTCLYWALANGAEVYPLIFDYGQRHRIEIEAAAKVLACAHEACSLGVVPGVLHTSETIRLSPGLLVGTSPLLATSKEALEQYPDAQSLPGGLEKTFVPLRNQLFLTIAANRAAFHDCASILTGVCQADNGGYPDCTFSFVRAFERACRTGTFTGSPEKGHLPPISIMAPLMHLTKKDEVLLAAGIPGCLDALAYSHTAYDGKYPPTGKDHASLLRARGFEEAGVPDPLVARAVAEGLMEYPKTTNYDSLRRLNDVL